MPVNVPFSTPKRHVGDQAYLIARYGRILVTVTNITPIGRIKIANPDRSVEAVFYAKTDYAGRHPHYSGGYQGCSLDFDIAGVDAEVARDLRARAAAQAVNRAHNANVVTREWSKDAMMSKVNDLQHLVDEARKAVEAI